MNIARFVFTWFEFPLPISSTHKLNDTELRSRNVGSAVSIKNRLPFLLALSSSVIANVLLMSGSIAMDIVAEGTPKAVLVVPDKPSPVVKYAASELQIHIQAASGAKLEILTESDAAKSKANPIFIGPCEALKDIGLETDSLPPNTFIIHSAKNALYLAGKDAADGLFPVDDDRSMGTLFAAYEWLDKQLGVRWLWPGKAGTYIPKSSEIKSADSGSVRVVPRLASSRIMFSTRGRYPSDDEVFNQSFLENNRWMRRQRLARSQTKELVNRHAFGKYWERFGKTHPEYFALRPDGVRAPVDERTNLVQLCVSDPGLWKQIVADVIETKTPDQLSHLWINGCENDRRSIDNFCLCEKCRSWDVPEAKVSVMANPWHIESRSPEMIGEWEKISMSDRYAKFWLALQAEGEKHSPDVHVISYAYSYYSDPPVRTKLNPNIVVLVVPSYVYPTPVDQSDRFRKLWDGWKATGATLGYRPNDFLLGYCLPYIFSHDYGNDFKYALNNGLMWTDFDSLTGMWGVQGPNLYMFGRLHSRPDLEVEEVLNEYYSAFGKAEPFIREYFDHWEEVTKRCDDKFHADIKGGYAALSKGGHLVFTDETFTQGRELLQQAKRALAGEDESFQDRVKYLEIWMDHADLAMKTLSSFREMQAKPDDAKTRQTFVDAYKSLNTYRQSNAEFFIGVNWDKMFRIEPWFYWLKENSI